MTAKRGARRASFQGLKILFEISRLRRSSRDPIERKKRGKGTKRV